MVRAVSVVCVVLLGGCASAPSRPPETPARPTPPVSRVEPPSALLPRPSDTTAELPDASNSFLVGGTPWTECSMAVPLSYVHPDCVPVRPVAVRASGSPETAALAADLDACTIWNAGDFAAEVIELDFGEVQTISALVIDPEATPGGRAMHAIDADDGTGTFVPRARIFGGYYGTVLYALVLPEPITTRRLRIRSVESQSWIAWREIVPLACSGPVEVWVAGHPPEPPPAPFDPHAPGLAFVPGRGECRQDADCVPSTCCAAPTCVSMPYAPTGCAACPADCSGPMDCGRGGCACVDGHCGAAIRE